MNILGLIEMRPFDGTDPFVCLRVDGPLGLFDLPITEDQLRIMLNNQGDAYEEESDEKDMEEVQVPQPSVNYEPSPVQNQGISNDTFVTKNRAEFSMGETTQMLEDDDL